ncbi:hypothetical protein DFH09DRAFT_1334823 [Mycena vulgaris]|nr:hypothetical protein DFH09DRAFT_1334823 [Mycena vulgaris]
MAPTLDLFRSDSRGEKPHHWLKKLKGLMAYDAKDEARLYRFENGLAPGAPAEKWWDELEAKDKATWADLMTAFKKKWPVPKEVEERPEELKERIKRTVLYVGDLGKLVGPEDDKMLAHLRSAADMRPLVEAIKDPTMLLNSDVRKTLPLEVRAVLPRTGLTTWDKWFDAVEALDGEALQDELERSRKHAGNSLPDNNREPGAFEADAFEGLMLSSPQSRSPAPPRVNYARAGPTSTPQHHSPTPQQGTARPYQQSAHPVTPQRQAPLHMPSNFQSTGNPFAPSPYQGNAAPSRFMQSLVGGSPGSPSAGRGSRASLGGDPLKDLEIARRAVANPRTYTATAAGMQQYQTDLAAWELQYAPTTGRAPDFATFPLSPGTLPAGSKECWSCGRIPMPPHFGVARCKQAGSVLVPQQRESNVRALIGNALYPPGERTPNRFAHVSQINVEEHDSYNAMGLFDVHQMLFDDQEDPEPGNGEGHA